MTDFGTIVIVAGIVVALFGVAHHERRINRIGAAIKPKELEKK